MPSLGPPFCRGQFPADFQTVVCVIGVVCCRKTLIVSTRLLRLTQRANPTTKSEWSSSIGSPNFALPKKSLQNVVTKCQRIGYARKIVTPRHERISYLNCAKRLASSLIDDCPHKIGPCDFSLYLLAQRILDADCCCLQLSAPSTQIIDLPGYIGNLIPNIGKSFLEVVGHGRYKVYTLNGYYCQAYKNGM